MLEKELFVITGYFFTCAFRMKSNRSPLLFNLANTVVIRRNKVSLYLPFWRNFENNLLNSLRLILIFLVYLDEYRLILRSLLL